MNDLRERVIDAEQRPLFNWRELWEYRELFYFFTWRDIKIKYKQTVLGFIWVVLQPLLMMTIFTFFFGRALRIPSQNLPYPVFVFSGLLIWNLFSAGLTMASNSMYNNAPIIKKIFFPRLVIPFSAILVALFDFFMAFLLFIPVLRYYKTMPTPAALVFWPMAIVLTIISTLGPGCLLAALNVKYRDFRYVIPFLVQVLFFLTPVIYPLTLVSYPFLQYFLVMSPVYAAVELFRFPLTGHMPDLTLLFISVGSSLLFLAGGIIYFKRTEDFFSDFA